MKKSKLNCLMIYYRVFVKSKSGLLLSLYEVM